MSDLIDRKKALDEISKIDTSIIPSGWVKGYVDETIKETQRIIRTIPSAEPERKNGEWIKVGHWGRTYKCNQCGNYLDFDGVNAGRGDANFCPNCSAKMEETK